jgi:hypothetical protein
MLKGPLPCGWTRAQEPQELNWTRTSLVEDWATLCLACPVTTTQGTRDAVAALEAAIEGAPGASRRPPRKGNGTVPACRNGQYGTIGSTSVKVDLWGKDEQP